MFADVTKMSNALWWGQRKGNWNLISATLKLDSGFLPFFFAWGRTHYMSAVVMQLRDLGCCSEAEQTLLELRCLLGKINENSQWCSLSYVTEVLNKYLKQHTPYLDAEGAAWIKTSQNLETFMRIFQIVDLLRGKEEKKGPKETEPNPERVKLLSSVIEKWNVLGVEEAMALTYSVRFPPNIHPYWKPLFQAKSISTQENDIDSG